MGRHIDIWAVRDIMHDGSRIDKMGWLIASIASTTNMMIVVRGRASALHWHCLMRFASSPPYCFAFNN